MPNSHWLVQPDGTVLEIDPRTAPPLDFARDFHLKVLALLDESKINNLSFYICIHPPVSLPRYGSDVVLVILGDEYHISFSYFSDILAVLRCYGTRQEYLDGVPTRLLRFLALLQFAYKSIGSWKLMLGSWLTGGTFPGLAAARTLHIPLGCFSECPSGGAEFASRKIDFAFLGSVGTSGEDLRRFSLRGILSPPKIRARREMIRALTQVMEGGKWNGVLQKTTTFADSTSKQLAYNNAMAQTKISVCPRGSNYETYRFYESYRSGCVVICEPLPDVWFYKDHPGIIIRNWTRLPEILDSLLSDPDRLQSLAAASRAFWDETLNKRVIAAHIEGFLVNLTENEKRNQSYRNLSRAQLPTAVLPE
ncbi:MAG: glycosyltransferase family 1 protein [Acidobacteria bacterium]|nr:glycosyltransferase family 1 protein [Acidobacteriota bacterium]